MKLHKDEIERGRVHQKNFEMQHFGLAGEKQLSMPFASVDPEVWLSET